MTRSCTFKKLIQQISKKCMIALTSAEIRIEIVCLSLFKRSHIRYNIHYLKETKKALLTLNTLIEKSISHILSAFQIKIFRLEIFKLKNELNLLSSKGFVFDKRVAAELVRDLSLRLNKLLELNKNLINRDGQ